LRGKLFLFFILAALPLSAMSKDIEFFCYAGSVETHVPLSIIRGIVMYESNGDINAIRHNRDGTVDRGPGQLNSQYISYFEWKFNEGRAIDPHSAESILITARILAHNYKIFGSWEKAITAYKWGVQGTRKYGVDTDYVWNVLDRGGFIDSDV